MTTDLTLEQKTALDLIIDHHKPYSLDDRLAARGVALVTLFDLETLGWTERWVVRRKADFRTFWTLTPWGARTLDVSLVEHGFRERPRWSRTGYEEPFIRNRMPARQEEIIDPELVPDPSSEPKLVSDETSGEAITLFGGYTILVDPRLKSAKGKKPKPKRKA